MLINETKGLEPNGRKQNFIYMSQFSLVKFNGTVNTTRSFWCQGCVQTDVLSGKHNIKSAALIRLFAQTIEAPKKRNRDCQSDKHTKRKSGKGQQ